MNEKDWEILNVIVQERSAAKAAERLFMTQPAVGYRMTRMEQEMGCRLFERSNRGVALTGAGERLLSYANRMLRQYTDIREHVKSQEGKISGTIHFGVSPAFAERYMPKLLKGFREKHPLVSVDLVVGLSGEIMSRIYHDEVLAAIIRGNHQWKENSVHLYDEALKLITPFAFTDISQLKQVPYVGYAADPVLQYQIDRWLHDNFIVPPPLAIHATGAQTCINIVQEGLGWALVPSMRTLGNDKIYKVTINDAEGTPYLRPSYLIYTNTAKEYAYYSAFIAYLQDWIRKSEFAENKAVLL